MINIDFKDRRPIYQQLIENIEDLAAKGILATDEQLPSVRSLAIELSINPNTIQKAYGELEKRGIIYSVAGKGSFIAQNRENLLQEKAARLVASLRDIFDQAKELGIAKEALLAHLESSGKEPEND